MNDGTLLRIAGRVASSAWPDCVGLRKSAEECETRLSRISALVASGIVPSSTLDRMATETNSMTSAAIAGLLPILREMENVEAGAMEHIRRTKVGS